MKVYRGYRVTARHLRATGACEDCVKTFRKEWPDGCDLTLKNLLRAADLALETDWFAENIGTAEDDSAWAEYDRVCNVADAKYRRACDAARNKYYRALARALWRVLPKKDAK